MTKEGLLGLWKNFYSFSRPILTAFWKVSRENFVLPEHKDLAYEDIALPLLDEQTISQPTTIMIMLDALELKSTDTVLELGGGSGYVGALLSHLARRVMVSEINPRLYHLCKRNLADYSVEVFYGDGFTLNQTFDKILVSAACPDFPEELLEKLNPNGILIVPVGEEVQKMIKYKRGKKVSLGNFVFVPIRR